MEVIDAVERIGGFGVRRKPYGALNAENHKISAEHMV